MPTLAEQLRARAIDGDIARSQLPTTRSMADLLRERALGEGDEKDPMGMKGLVKRVDTQDKMLNDVTGFTQEGFKTIVVDPATRMDSVKEGLMSVSEAALGVVQQFPGIGEFIESQGVLPPVAAAPAPDAPFSKFAKSFSTGRLRAVRSLVEVVIMARFLRGKGVGTKGLAGGIGGTVALQTMESQYFGVVARGKAAGKPDAQIFQEARTEVLKPSNLAQTALAGGISAIAFPLAVQFELVRRTAITTGAKPAAALLKEFFKNLGVDTVGAVLETGANMLAEGVGVEDAEIGTTALMVTLANIVASGLDVRAARGTKISAADTEIRKAKIKGINQATEEILGEVSPVKVRDDFEGLPPEFEIPEADRKFLARLRRKIQESVDEQTKVLDDQEKGIQRAQGEEAGEGLLLRTQDPNLPVRPEEVPPTTPEALGERLAVRQVSDPKLVLADVDEFTGAVRRETGVGGPAVRETVEPRADDIRRAALTGGEPPPDPTGAQFFRFVQAKQLSERVGRLSEGLKVASEVGKGRLPETASLAKSLSQIQGDILTNALRGTPPTTPVIRPGEVATPVPPEVKGVVDAAQQAVEGERQELRRSLEGGERRGEEEVQAPGGVAPEQGEPAVRGGEAEVEGGAEVRGGEGRPGVPEARGREGEGGVQAARRAGQEVSPAEAITRPRSEDDTPVRVADPPEEGDLEVLNFGLGKTPRIPVTVTRAVSAVIDKSRDRFSKMGEPGARFIELLDRAQGRKLGEVAQSFRAMDAGLTAGLKTDGIPTRNRKAVNKFATDALDKVDQGKTDDLSPGQVQLIDAWRGEARRVAIASNEAGIYILDPRTGPRPVNSTFANFVPRLTSRKVLNQIIQEVSSDEATMLLRTKSSRISKLAEHLVQEGKANTLEEALVSIRDYYDPRFGGLMASLERPRTLSHPPEWLEPDGLKRINNYIEQAWNRIGEVESFGQDGAKSLALNSLLRLEGGERPSFGEWESLKRMANQMDPAHRPKTLERVLRFAGPPGPEGGWRDIREQAFRELQVADVRGGRLRAILEQIRSRPEVTPRQGAADAKAATTLYEGVFDRRAQTDFGRAWNYWEGNLTAISKVTSNGLNFIAQTMGLIRVASSTGVIRSMKASRILHTEVEAREFVDNSGAMMSDFLNILAEGNEMDGILGQVTRTTAKFTGVTATDRYARKVQAMGANLMMRDGLRLREMEVQGTLPKGIRGIPGPAMQLRNIRHRLSQWGSDLDRLHAQGGPSSDETKRIMQRAVSQSQAGGGPLEDPVWTGSNAGRSILRVKRFAINEARFGFVVPVNDAWRFVKSRGEEGSWGGLLLYLGGGVIAGEVYLNIKNWVQGRSREEDLGESLKRAGDIIRGDDRSIENANILFQRLLDDFQWFGGFGILMDSLAPSRALNMLFDPEIDDRSRARKIWNDFTYSMDRAFTPVAISSARNIGRTMINIVLNSFEIDGAEEMAAANMELIDKLARREFVLYGRGREAFITGAGPFPNAGAQERILEELDRLTTTTGKPRRGQEQRVRSLQERLRQLR